MTVAKNNVVTIDYTLRDGEGTILEESGSDDEFAYLHGHGQLLDVLEAALEGKPPGYHLELTVAVDEGFGQRNEELVISVPRDHFPEDESLETGMQVEAETDQGHQIFTILAADEASVTLDGNHPYAGIPLAFDVTIQAIREASPEELEHGHAHDGEHHH